MPIPVPVHSSPTTAPTAIVRTVSRDDLLWNRPVFKAPPLEVATPPADLSELERAVRKPEAFID